MAGDEANRPPAPAEARVRLLFDALRGTGNGVTPRALVAALERVGLRLDDPRLRGTARELDGRDRDELLDVAAFRDAVAPNLLLVERAVQGDLVIPAFPSFRDTLAGFVTTARADRTGTVADYIPQLGQIDPERFAVSLCTVDGQRAHWGDAGVPFCLQSCCKPVTYAMALEEHGESGVHAHVGWEPSGHTFNELRLNDDGLPHNPMINAGAIVCGALIRQGLHPAARFDEVQALWRRLAGGVKPGFDNATYLSERRTADRNFALGYFMREHGVFPEDTDLVGSLEFYFQCCALEMDADAIATVAATFAHGGVCPTTGERVLHGDTVQKCLSMMYSCGMYDFSGEWAFRIGLPAKSGVSGAVMVVVPGVLGLCVWSPRLDEHGNSVRAIRFCRDLVSAFNFHQFDNVLDAPRDKRDPRSPPEGGARADAAALCWAASCGDLDAVRSLVARGVDLGAADYDGRTALHLAAAEGHQPVVELFVARGAPLDAVDRWGHTPADDATRAGHDAVARLLGAVP